MSSPISRADFDSTGISIRQSGQPASESATPPAPENASGHQSSSRDEVQVSLAARIRRLQSDGETLEMIAAELDLPLETIHTYLQKYL